jgi:hypothetical protein
MATLQTTRPTSKPRTFRILRRPAADASGRLLLTIDGVSFEYDYLLFPTYDGSAAFTLFHEDGDESRIYTVVIGEKANTCDCKGFEFRGKCKHTAALAVLVAREAQAAVPVCSPAPPAKSCLRCGGGGMVRRQTAGGESVSRCGACSDF